MDEQSGEWEMEEYYNYRSDENSNRSVGKVSWVFDKGLCLGKKILFTGFLISSATLTLPPLVVISAIGLVVSIPSGIFLASYACSETLMRKLLPIPDQQQQETEEHRGVKRKIESEELLDDDIGSVDMKGKEEEVEIDESGGERLEEPVVVVEEIVVEEIEPVSGEKEVVQVTTVVVVAEERENGVSEENKEIQRETKGLLELIRDEGKTADQNKSPQEISLSKDDQSAINTTNKDDQSAISTKKGDQSAVSTTTTELPVSHGAKETKDRAGISSETAGQTTHSNNEAKKKKNVKKKPVASAAQQPQTQKVLYNEEEIWEQIAAMRKIVGYKATAQKSSIEELKALYIFTGVEPPASFREPSDIAEVNNKLQFLKSIIGVN